MSEQKNILQTRLMAESNGPNGPRPNNTFKSDNRPTNRATDNDSESYTTNGTKSSKNGGQKSSKVDVEPPREDDADCKSSKSVMNGNENSSWPGTTKGKKRAIKRSPNKTYHTPPSPTPLELSALERAFTLDCVAVDTTSRDYGRARPKLGQVLPPYNAQRDRATAKYFHATGVNKTLNNNGQKYPGVSVERRALERFHECGTGYQYLSRRNTHGAGHSRETIDGHAQFMTDLKPFVGYNGRFGYRRTTPWLRRTPSTFGLVSDTPIH